MDELTEKVAEWLFYFKNPNWDKVLDDWRESVQPQYIREYEDAARELLALMPFEEIRGISIDVIDYIDEAEVHHQCKDLIIGNNRRILSLLPTHEPQPDKRQQLIDKLTAIRKRIEDSGQPLLSMDEIIERLRGGE